jgi:dGTPase
LSAHVSDYDGLNLTRASLNAVLKYPWLPGAGSRPDKYGAYRSDSAAFDFAREGATGPEKSLEAAIMDLADSITYSVHDLFDFYQAGLVPLWELSDDLPEYVERFKASGKVDEDEIEEHYVTLERLAALLPGRSYRGSIDDRILVKSQSSWLISEFVSNVALKVTDSGCTIEIPPDVEVKMRFLQSLVWSHVIASPALSSQQLGQVRVVRELYDSFLESARGRGPHGLNILPPAYAHVVPTLAALDPAQRAVAEARLAADVVASLTEEQARRLHKRVMGLHQGSVVDHLKR